MAPRPPEHQGATSPIPVDGLPGWFVVLCVASITLAVSIPVPVVKYLIGAVMGLAFLTFYRNAPHRTLLVFVLAVPVLRIFPPELLPIRGLNVETVFMVALIIAAIRGGQIAGKPAPPNALRAPLLFLAGMMTASAVRSAALLAVRQYEFGVWLDVSAFEIFASLKTSLTYFVVPVISFHLLSTTSRIRAATRVIACAASLISLEAIFRTGRALASGGSLENHRAIGMLTEQPNLFGGFLALTIVALFPLFLGSRAARWDRLLFAFAIGTCGLALMFTLSRGAWMALIVAVAFVTMFRATKIIPVLLILVATAGFWLPSGVVERVGLTTQGKSDPDQLLDDSAQVRVDQWKTFPRIFAAKPLFGHGFMMFQKVWEDYGPSHSPKSAHSAIINFGSEEGILGLIGYFWVIGTVARRSWILFRRSETPYLQDLALGVLGAMVCLLILDTSGNRFVSGGVMAYTLVLAGASVRAGALLTTETPVKRMASGR